MAASIARTCDGTAERCAQPLCAAIVCDAALALVLVQHEAVAAVVLRQWLVVEQRIPAGVMRLLLLFR